MEKLLGLQVSDDGDPVVDNILVDTEKVSTDGMVMTRHCNAGDMVPVMETREKIWERIAMAERDE